MAENMPGEVLRGQELAKNGGISAMSQYNQKVIEQKEQELRELVMANYSRIKGVERELANLQLQVKLTAGPKRQALELMRKKIECQNEVVATVRQRYLAAKQVYLALEAELAREEEEKDKLCNELNTLIQQSTALQLSKLEELRRHLELLNQGIVPGTAAATALTASSQQSSATVVAEAAPTPHPAACASGARGASSDAHQAATNPFAPAATCNSGARGAIDASQQAATNPFAPGSGSERGQLDAERRPTPSGSSWQVAQQQQGMPAAVDPAAAAAAAAARSRHVAINGSKTRPGQSARSPTAGSATQQSGSNRVQRGSDAPFSGFDT